MINRKKIEQFSKKVHESVPQGVRAFSDEVEKKIRQLLQAQLARFDLVSRQEFDIKTRILLQTQEKIAELEQRLVKLENAYRSEEEESRIVPSS